MNQFEEVCLLASKEDWCWNLNCTTCGCVDFRYAFLSLRNGISPSDNDWVVSNKSKTSYKLLDEFPYKFSETQKIKIITTCLNSNIASIVKFCKLPDALGYIGLVLEFMECDADKYYQLSSLWVSQLLKIIPDNSLLNIRLNELATSNTLLLNINDLELCEEILVSNNN